MVQLLNYKSFHIDYLFYFSSKNKLLHSFNHKINYNLVISFSVFIYLMYIKVLWITLKLYLTYLNVFDPHSKYIKHIFVHIRGILELKNSF